MEIYQKKKKSIYRSLIKEIKNKHTNLYLATLCDLSEAYISDFIRGNRELNEMAISKILKEYNIIFDISDETYTQAKNNFFELLDCYLGKDESFSAKIRVFLNNEQFHYSYGYYYYHFGRILEIIKNTKEYQRLNFEFDLLFGSNMYFSDEENQIIKTLLSISSFYFPENKFKQYRFFSASSDSQNSLFFRQQKGCEGLFYYFAGLEYYKRNNLKEAIEQCTRAVKYYMLGGYLIRVLECEVCLANYYLLDKDYELAYRLYESTIYMCKQLTKKTNLALKCKVNISYIDLITNQPQKCIDILTEIIDEKNSNILINLCFAYYFINDFSNFRLISKRIDIKEYRQSHKIEIDLLRKIQNDASSEEMIQWYMGLEKGIEDMILILKVLVHYCENKGYKDACIYFQKELLNN